MKMKIKREYDRAPIGNYPGIFCDWDIEEKNQ